MALCTYFGNMNSLIAMYPGSIPGIQTKNYKTLYYQHFHLKFKLNLSLYIIKYNKKRYLIMKYTKEIIEKEIHNAISISDLVRKITGKNEITGSTHNLISKRIKLFNLDTSHFLSTNEICNIKNIKKRYNITSKEILRFNPLLYKREKRHKLLKAMLDEGIIYKCNSCGINPEWNKKPLKLDIDHIDGNWKNNNIKNLRFLCPNCHSQTETYGYKNKEKTYYYTFSEFSNINLLLTKSVFYSDYKKQIKEKKIRIEEIKQPKIKKERKKFFCKNCYKEVSHNSKSFCKICNAINKRKIKKRPSIEILIQDLKELGSYIAVAKKYGVSDTSIKKWIKKYGSEKISSDYINFEKKVIEIKEDINNKIKILANNYKHYKWIQYIRTENKKNNLSQEKLDLIKLYKLPFFEVTSPKEILEKRKIEYIDFIKENKRKPIFSDKVSDIERSLARWPFVTKKKYPEFINELKKEVEELLK